MVCPLAGTKVHWTFVYFRLALPGPLNLQGAARRKLLYLHDAAELLDLRTPPGNRLEAKKGQLAGYYSIRINDQWRILFRWEGGNAKDVQVTDYH